MDTFHAVIYIAFKGPNLNDQVKHNKFALFRTSMT